ncbi:MAG: TIGR02186 family protein [Alphaproteobacteria bacterium]
MRPGDRHAPARLLRGLVWTAALCLPASGATQAPILADLSSYAVEIDTGFTGEEVVLFGAVDGGGDVIVVVRGPAQSAVVREKQRVAGIWVNAPGIQFVQAPSFYAVAATRPIADLLDDTLRRQREIGVDMLRLMPSPGTAEDFDAAAIAAHRDALIGQMERRGLYADGVAPIAIQSGRLFRTRLAFPSDVPTGFYDIRVYEVRDGAIVEATTTPLNIRKVGLEAELFRFAYEIPAIYGACAVLIAFAAGFLPTVLRWLR